MELLDGGEGIDEEDLRGISGTGFDESARGADQFVWGERDLELSALCGELGNGSS